MGKLEGITIKEEKKQLADLIEPKIKGDKQLPLFDNQPVIEQYATEFSKRAIEEKPLILIQIVISLTRAPLRK
jgi:hypothetical protein